MATLLFTAVEVNGLQLAAEVRTAISRPVEVGYANGSLAITGDITEADRSAIQAAINAHVPDPNYGQPSEDTYHKALRVKAQAVFDGTDTFTAAQIQKIVAGLVLRETR